MNLKIKNNRFSILFRKVNFKQYFGFFIKLIIIYNNKHLDLININKNMICLGYYMLSKHCRIFWVYSYINVNKYGQLHSIIQH